MTPFTPHLEEAFKLLREHMRSTDPRVSIRACRTIIAADLRYKMLEYTAVRAEYSALKHQYTAPPAPHSAPPTTSETPTGAPRTAQSAPRAPAPPRFDELREELRLAPEHRELVTKCFWNPDREGGGRPPHHSATDSPPAPEPAHVSHRSAQSSSTPPRPDGTSHPSPAALLISSAGAACTASPLLNAARTRTTPNTT